MPALTRVEPEMKRVLTTACVLSTTLLALTVGTDPAHADAASGVCATGNRLGSYSTSRAGYNWLGERMFTITVRKRWCYSIATHRVGSAYYPKPSVNISNEFNAAWDWQIIDSDAYYTSAGPDGRSHPGYPRWAHVSWFKVKMCHNALGTLGCIKSYI